MDLAAARHLHRAALDHREFRTRPEQNLFLARVSGVRLHELPRRPCISADIARKRLPDRDEAELGDDLAGPVSSEYVGGEVGAAPGHAGTVVEGVAEGGDGGGLVRVAGAQAAVQRPVPRGSV